MKQILKILILLSVAVPGYVSSQSLTEMRVVEKSAKFLPEELIDKSVIDANGDVCAGLKIRTDQEGLSFQSNNGIVKLNTEPGEYTLFLQSSEQVVKVFKLGYANLRIILADYGIKLVAGQTWEITISGEKKQDLISITIKTRPENSTIKIDGKDMGVNPIQHVSLGKHELIVEKSGFQPVTQSIDVSPNNVFFEVEIKEIEMVLVEIKSDPQDAIILIDNADKGKTDKGTYLYPGKYKLKLLLPGYLDMERDIEITTNGKNVFSYTLTKNTGTLNISVTPSDAKIYLNKELVTDVNNIDIPPGKNKIEVQKDGYYDTAETFTMELGKTITKMFSLRQKVGRLRVSISPLDAIVTLKKNGAEISSWQGAKQIEDLAVGDYLLTATAEKYHSEEKQISINLNSITNEDFQLQKKVDEITPGHSDRKRSSIQYPGDSSSALPVTTESGLAYIDIVPGTGASPRYGDKVTAHYTGYLLDGKKFDSSVDRDQPFTFIIGQGQVIRGWDEGVMTMKVGGKRKLIIPPELGYGMQGASGGLIPPNSTLVFDVQLINVGQ